MTIHPTRNDLPESARKQVIPLLNAHLADGIDLALQAKQAHWNVKGPHFLPLHELFDKLYDQASEWNDLVAERGVQLGGIAEGTLQSVSAKTRLHPYNVELTSGKDHLEALTDAVAVYARCAREGIEAATRAGDADTADIFTEISRASDKMLWFLESHLRGKE
jgi:starvation-inducible DNA-binding protein